MKRETWWPIGIVATLGLTVAANVVVFILAGRGDGAGVVPDYYRKAVAWDSTQAVAARSAALGWVARADLAAPAASTGGCVTMVVGLTDAAGHPVKGATVRIEGFALAHSAATRTDTLLVPANGRYAASIHVPRVEWYEFRLTADRGGDRFVADLRCLPGQTCRPA